MANQWFKFYGAEYLSDPKMDRLIAQERSCWITLLCMASQSDGFIKFLSVEGLLNKSGVTFNPYDSTEWDNAKNVLQNFEKYEMIKIDKNGVIEVVNWEKRQEHVLTPYERVKKYRDKNRIDNKLITDDNGNDNDRIEENRIDKNINTTAKADVPFSIKEEIKKLEDNPRREMNIIALYFEHRKPDLQSKEQYSQALKRHLKAAIALKPFNDTQILKALDYCKKEYKDIYTLETLLKIITK